MNRSIKIKIFGTLLTMLIAGAAIAQENNFIPLNLDEAIQATIANNHQIKSAQFNLQSAKSDVDQMIVYRLPQVDANLTGSVTNLPLNSFGSSLQQGAIEQADFIPSSLNNPKGTTNLQSQIIVQQPLMNLTVKSMKEAMKSKAAAFEQKTVRTEELISAHVSQAYLQLQLSHAMLSVVQTAKETAESSLKLTQDNIDAGYLQKVDLLSVQIRLNEIENQIFEVRSNIIFASNQLSYLMGTDLGTLYLPSEQLIDVDRSQILSEELPNNRSDFNAMNHQIEAQNHMLSVAKKTNLPQINAFGSYEVNNPLDFQEVQHGYMVGLQTSWKIFDGLKSKSSIQKAKIEIEQSINSLDQAITESELELERVKRKMLAARNKINLSKKAIEQSKEALRIKVNRYQEGLEKTTDVLYAETIVAQKEMSYVEAIYQYQLAYDQLTTLLEKNK